MICLSCQQLIIRYWICFTFQLTISMLSQQSSSGSRRTFQNGGKLSLSPQTQEEPRGISGLFSKLLNLGSTRKLNILFGFHMSYHQITLLPFEYRTRTLFGFSTTNYFLYYLWDILCSIGTIWLLNTWNLDYKTDIFVHSTSKSWTIFFYKCWFS